VVPLPIAVILPDGKPVKLLPSPVLILFKPVLNEPNPVVLEPKPVKFEFNPPIPNDGVGAFIVKLVIGNADVSDDCGIDNMDAVGIAVMVGYAG